MKRKRIQRIQTSKEFSDGVGRALRRATKVARKTARMPRHADLHLEELQSRRRKAVAIESAAAEASYRSFSAFVVLGKTHEHDHARRASTITEGPLTLYFSRVTPHP